MNVPVLRIELEGMRHALQVAVAEHSARMDADVSATIDAFCTPENLQRIIDEQVRMHMKLAVEEAVRSFFSYGPGKTTIREAVFAALEEQFKYGEAK